jgi:hypothetical protein
MTSIGVRDVSDTNTCEDPRCASPLEDGALSAPTGYCA